MDNHYILFPLDWNLEFTITTAFCDDHLYTMNVADNTAYMPCHGKSQMVTVDLTNFQINVLFTPDTQWFHPGMFTVDKDIYTIYSSYTGSPNKVRWKVHSLGDKQPSRPVPSRCEPSSEMGRLATGLEWMDGLKSGLEVLPTLTTPSCHQMQSGPTRRLGFPTVGSHAKSVKLRVTKYC